MALYRWLVSFTSATSVRVGGLCLLAFWIAANRQRLGPFLVRLRRIVLWGGRESLR